MRTSVPGQASSSPVDRAADGPEALRQLHLPNEIWQQIARAVRTQCRLRGVHFSPEDDKALKLLKSVSQTVETLSAFRPLLAPKNDAVVYLLFA